MMAQEGELGGDDLLRGRRADRRGADPGPGRAGKSVTRSITRASLPTGGSSGVRSTNKVKGVTAEYGLGIDLGTTQTAAAVLAGGRVETARLGARRAEIPSAVFVKADGGLLVGEAAERRGQDEPGRLAREFKRRMGDPVPILAGGVPFSAHALTAKLLRHVLDTVTRLQDGPPTSVALTYPANWGPYKREQLDQAIRLADAGPVRLLTEPEAAARQHAIARRIAPGETVAVYDLGGGTFDVAVLRREGDGFELLGPPEGIEQLGGADFDEAVFAHVLGALDGGLDGLDPNDPEAVLALARLRRDCVEAKESLSFDTEATIPVALPGRHTRVRLNRSEFEAMIAPSVQDTVEATRRALRSAGVEPSGLSAILLAGGSSRIPLVATVLAAEFERPVVADPHPEYSIALGAASTTAADLPAASRAFSAASGPAGAAASNPANAAASGPASAAANSPASAAANNPANAAASSSATAAANGSATKAAAPATSTASTAAAGPPTSTAAADLAATGFATGAYPPDPAAAVPNGSASNGSSPKGANPNSANPNSAAPPNRPATPNGPRPQRDFTDLHTPADPWAAAEAAEAAAARAAAADAHAAAETDVESATMALPAPRPPVAQPTRIDEFAGVRPTSGSPGGPPPPSYAMGAATIPDSEPSIRFVPRTYTPAPPEKRSRRTLVIAGVAVIVLAAVGTAVGLALSHRDKPTAAPARKATSAPVVPAALPTDPMLVRVDTGGPVGSTTRVTRIYYFTPGDSARHELPGTKPGDVLPRWSHDRQQIALTHTENGTNKIYLMNKDGSDRRPFLTGVTGGRVAWSIDDTKLAYVKKDDDGVPQIFIQPIAGGDAKQLTRSKDDKDDPVWSADGKSIVYWARHDGTKSIYSLSIADSQEPGTAITQPTLGDAVDPAVSPDGRQVLFTLVTSKTDSDVWLVGSDGSDPHAVADESSREMDPTWAPKGKWFAFVRGDYDHPQVVAERADGTDPTPLTQGSAREGHPCWF
jgi:molecular chaperone DnaK